MANETRYHVTVDIDGVETSLSRAGKAWGGYALTSEQAAARQKLAQDAINEAVASGVQMDKQRALSIMALADSISKQAEVAGKTRAELLSMQAAGQGVSTTLKSQLDAIAKASEGAHGGTAGITRELFVMGHEAMTGNISRVPGSFMVLAERMDLVALAANPVVLGIAAIGAAAVGMGVAVAQGAEESTKLNMAIKLTGDYAGVTASSIKLMGNAINEVRGNHGDNADDVLSSLIGTGKVGAQSLEAVTNAVLDYAAATKQSAQEAQKAFEPMFDDPLKGAIKLNESMHFLTPAIYDHIKALEEVGDKDGALKAAMEAMDAEVKSQTDHAGYLASAWDSVTGAVKGAWRAMMDWGKQATLQDKLAAAQTNLVQAKANQMTHGATHFTGLIGLESDTDRAKAVANAQKAVDDAQQTVRDEALKAQQQTTDALVTQSHINTDRLNQEHMKNADKRAKVALDAEKEYQTRVAAMRANGTYSKAADDQFSQERDAKIEEANRQYKDSGASSAAQNVIGGKLAALEAQQKEVEANLAASVDHIRSLRQAGVIDAESALQQEHDARAKALQDELSIQEQEAEIAKGKKQLSAFQKYQGDVKATQDRIVAENQKYTDDLAALQEKRAEVVQAYTAKLQGELDKQRAASDKAVMELGMTENEKAAYDAKLKIEEDYLKEKADIEAKYARHEINDDQRTQMLGAASNNSTARAAAVDDGQAKLLAAQGDWTVGATKALKQYQENAGNVASQVQSAFQDAFSGMEDAFVKFCQTGKFDFGDLAKSIIADIEKMAAKAAVSGLFSWATSAVSSYFSPGASSTDFSGAFHLATGGSVAGPGSGTSDSIPAWLSNGEYVLKADAVQRIGVDNLDKLNNGAHIGSAARYASGGLVSSQVSSVSGASSANGSAVSVVVNSGGGLDQSDGPLLEKAIKAIVDSRIAQKMKGQGGYAWQLKNGGV